MAEIMLAGGQMALVDDEDAELVSGYRWHAHAPGRVTYARSGGGADGRWLMHRLILRPELGVLVDHANGDGLDNRRSNIRLCSKAENNSNRRQRPVSRTGFIGVLPHRGKFAAQLYINGGSRHLGTFATPEDAALARDRAAAAAYGSFAILNFPGAA